MMNSTKMIMAAGVLAVAASGAARAQDVVDLSPRYDAQKQTSYRHQLHVDQTRIIPLISDTRRLVAEMERDITVETIEVLPTGEARVRLVIDRVKMNVTPPEGEPFQFDSADNATHDESSSRAAALASYVAGEVDVLLAPNGELMSIEAIRGYGNPAAAGRAAKEIDVFFNDKWIQTVMEAIWSASPEVPVRRTGEQWQQQKFERVGSAAGNDVMITWTLDGMKDDLATISGAGAMATDELGQVQFDGSPALKLEDLITYRYEWDVNLGRAERYETDQAVGVAFDTQMGVEAQSVVASSVRLWKIEQDGESGHSEVNIDAERPEEN